MPSQTVPSLSELTPTQLAELYLSFVEYRDEECDGMAKMSVAEFHESRWSPE